MTSRSDQFGKSEIVAPGGRIYHLGLAQGELARNVLIAGDPARAERIAERFDTVEHRISNREFVTFSGRLNGIPVSAVGTGIGADNVEIAFVESYILNEFDLDSKVRNPDVPPMTFIRLGTSGGVQPDIAPGTLAISEYAIGLDSTGIYYEVEAPDEVSVNIEVEAARILDEALDGTQRFSGFIKPYVSKASPIVTAALVSAAERRSIEFRKGITITSPGFYGPSSRRIDGFSNTVPDIKLILSNLEVAGRRVLNMEMESSLLFHLAAAVGYRAGTICPVISGPLESDSLIDYDKVIDHTIEIGLEALAALSQDI